MLSKSHLDSVLENLLCGVIFLVWSLSLILSLFGVKYIGLVVFDWTETVTYLLIGVVGLILTLTNLLFISLHFTK